jgi:hypothetical protein
MPSLSEAILSNCQPTWLKVARVVASTHRDLGLPDDEVAYDAVALELARLVETGTLEAVGDLSNWRESEVRLATRSGS